MNGCQFYLQKGLIGVGLIGADEHFFVFNLFVLDYLNRKKFAVILDLASPESIAWSRPLPPEQWARRSPELEAAIAEQEQDLATAVATDQEQSEAA